MAGVNLVVSSLQKEFQEAKQGLNDVDNNIRKLTGRVPSTGTLKSKVAVRRTVSQNDCDDEVPDASKRRKTTVFSRIDRHERIEEEPRKPTLASSVVVTSRPVKPRTEAIEEQKGDQRSLARNRRMFGMILGTLQKFQSEESRRKPTVEKREQIEKKLEKVAEEEKIAVIKERKELFKSRRQKQAEIRRVEHKMERVELQQEWEKSHQHLGGFIRTKAKPFLFYLPKEHNDETEKRLQDTKDKYRLIIAEKRAKVQKELSEIDDSYKKEVDGEFDDDDLATMETEESFGSNGAHPEHETDNNGSESMVTSTDNVIEHEDVQVNSHDDETEDVAAEMEDAEDVIETLEEKEFEPIYDE
ncbi:Pinin [Halotydeus destructor]|nr:Pinin [Halotydeus destructor]